MNFPNYKSRNEEMLEIGAALAMGASSMFGRRPSKNALAHAEWRREALAMVPKHDARTPKPEEIFKRMIADGTAELVRRRGKPPLLKRIIPNPHKRY